MRRAVTGGQAGGTGGGSFVVTVVGGVGSGGGFIAPLSAAGCDPFVQARATSALPHAIAGAKAPRQCLLDPMTRSISRNEFIFSRCADGANFAQTHDTRCLRWLKGIRSLR
jgi:hypothetical protein